MDNSWSLCLNESDLELHTIFWILWFKKKLSIHKANFLKCWQKRIRENMHILKDDASGEQVGNIEQVH